MKLPSLQEMLKAGVHFGHQTLRWNPKMKKYILAEKNGIHIIDLSQTEKGLEHAIGGISNVIASHKNILFVGTKKSVRHCIKEKAIESNSFFVTDRWLGGMLTNFSTVKQSIGKLDKIENDEKDGLHKELKKKQVLSINKQKDKLETVLGGIRKMHQLPGMLFIVDTKHEHIAVKEAKKLGIPIAAIVDSNSNPDDITYPIPGNDDAIKSVTMLLSVIASAINDQKAKYKMQEGTDSVSAKNQKEAPESASEPTLEKPKSDEPTQAVAETTAATATQGESK